MLSFPSILTLENLNNIMFRTDLYQNKIITTTKKEIPIQTGLILLTILVAF